MDNRTKLINFFLHPISGRRINMLELELKQAHDSLNEKQYLLNEKEYLLYQKEIERVESVRRAKAFETRMRHLAKVQLETSERLVAIQKRLFQSETRLQQITSDVPGAVSQWVVEKSTGKMWPEFFSEGLYELIGLKPREALEDQSRIWAIIVPEDLEKLQKAIGAAGAGETPGVDIPIRYNTPAGLKHIRIMASIIHEPSREIHTIYFSDVSELVGLQQQAKTSEARMRALAEEQLEASETMFLAQRKLQESEARMRALIQNAPFLIYSIDNDGFFTFSEGRDLEKLGLKPGEAVGQNVYEMYRDLPETLKLIREALEGNASSTVVKVADIWFESHYEPIKDMSGNIQGMVGLSVNITERKKAEEVIKASEAKLLQITKEVPGVVSQWVVDKASGQMRPDFIGEGLFDLIGLETQKAWEDYTRIFALMAPGDAKKLQEAIATASTSGGSHVDQIARFNTPSGIKHIKITAAIFHEADHEIHTVYYSDVSEIVQLQLKAKTSEARMRELAEEQLEATEKLLMAEKQLKTMLEEEQRSKKLLQETQSQLVNNEKMASLGQLTAGIAHEINNPINFVYNGIDALRLTLDELMLVVEKVSEWNQDGPSMDAIIKEVMEIQRNTNLKELGSDIQELVSDIKKGAVRTMEIVKGLRVFSRLDEEEQKPADINENLDATLVLLRNKTKDKIAIKKYYDLTLGKINCFPGQLNQVFMNIISNAIQAIPEENNDGKIMIYTEGTEHSVIIRIKDNGTGMPEDVKRRIFEPFFTTKPVGVGTGLGMSISYGIIEKHNGRIYVESEPGKGTEFVISIPKK